MRQDVLNIIKTHKHYVDNKIGNKGLGYLTRSGVVMLCAAWERYNEDLLLESIDSLCSVFSDVNELPVTVQKTLSRLIKNDSHELSPIEMAGDGWTQVWKNKAFIKTEILNTPKTRVLKTMFNEYLGISDYTEFWCVDNSDEIDVFVSDRGDIAHNGNKAAQIRISKLKTYQDMVVENVINIDSRIATEIKLISKSSSLPWTQDYAPRLSYYK